MGATFQTLMAPSWWYWPTISSRQNSGTAPSTKSTRYGNRNAPDATGERQSAAHDINIQYKFCTGTSHPPGPRTPRSEAKCQAHATHTSSVAETQVGKTPSTRTVHTSTVHVKALFSKKRIHPLALYEYSKRKDMPIIRLLSSSMDTRVCATLLIDSKVSPYVNEHIQ